MFGLKERITRIKKASYEPPISAGDNSKEVSEINLAIRLESIERQLMSKSSYRIFTKEDYRSYFFNVYLKTPDIDKESIKHMERAWDRTRKGYNFLIAVGKDDDLHFFSVKGFEEMILGGKV